MEFTLLKDRNTWFRLDVFPFIFVHAGILYWLITVDEENEVYPKIGFIIGAFLNSFTFLLG